jgi:putative membrane protein
MKCTRLLVVISIAALNGIWSNGAAADGKLDDATILAIFDQANSVDIYTGRLGAKDGYTEEVRALGRMVAADHVAVQQMGRDLAKKLNIIPTPPDNDTSVADEAKTVSSLQAVTGQEFDRAYLRHEIAFHQSVIEAIRKTLLPATKNSELASLIKKVLPGFEHHLAATKAVAAKMHLDQ